MKGYAKLDRSAFARIGSTMDKGLFAELTCRANAFSGALPDGTAVNAGELPMSEREAGELIGGTAAAGRAALRRLAALGLVRFSGRRGKGRKGAAIWQVVHLVERVQHARITRTETPAQQGIAGDARAHDAHKRLHSKKVRTENNYQLPQHTQPARVEQQPLSAELQQPPGREQQRRPAKATARGQPDIPITEGFEALLSDYPKHRAGSRQRTAAWRIWRERELEGRAHDVYQGLLRWRNSRQWERGAVHNVDTWLEGEHWRERPEQRGGGAPRAGAHGIGGSNV